VPHNSHFQHSSSLAGVQTFYMQEDSSNIRSKRIQGTNTPTTKQYAASTSIYGVNAAVSQQLLEFWLLTK